MFISVWRPDKHTELLKIYLKPLVNKLKFFTLVAKSDLRFNVHWSWDKNNLSWASPCRIGKSHLRQASSLVEIPSPRVRFPYLTWALMMGCHNIHCSWCCAVLRPYNVCPYIIILQIIFMVLWDHWVHFSHLKIEFRLSQCQGRGRCCIFHYWSWTDSTKPSLHYLHF